MTTTAQLVPDAPLQGLLRDDARSRAEFLALTGAHP